MLGRKFRNEEFYKLKGIQELSAGASKLNKIGWQLWYWFDSKPHKNWDDQ